MGAGSAGSPDVVINADLFPVWSTEATIGDLGPGRFAIREFCRCATVVIVLANGMVQFTAEDAADRVTLSAALRKWLVMPVVAGSLSTSRWARRPVLTRQSVFGKNGRWILFFYEQLEFICRLRCLIFHGVMINVEFCWFSTVFTT
jgi:hypothetical protein